MKAAVWHGYEDVRVDDVPDPRIEEPTDAIIRVTTSGRGSDLHLYSIMENFLEGDILGHEPMGIVEKKEDGAIKVLFQPWELRHVSRVAVRVPP
jgi:threonine dehydrogenase-like Zn-dependent dehydrogenase